MEQTDFKNRQSEKQGDYVYTNIDNIIKENLDQIEYTNLEDITLKDYINLNFDKLIVQFIDKMSKDIIQEKEVLESMIKEEVDKN